MNEIIELTYRYPNDLSTVAICPKCVKDVYSGPQRKFYCKCGCNFKALNAMTVKDRNTFLERKKVK